MASSGTYAFAPENADLFDEAFERCGIDPATLTVRHLRSARMSIGLMFTQWEQDTVRLFQVDNQTQTLTAGDDDYSVASGTLLMLDGYITRDDIVTPVRRIFRDTYEAIPDKSQRGMPTDVYHDRATGIYYLWQTPDSSSDVFSYTRLRMIQDIGTAAQTPDLQRKWWEPMVAGLAERLSLKFAPDRHAKLKTEAKEAYAIARSQEVERGDTVIEVGAG